MRKNFWIDAARRGAVLGLIVAGEMVVSTWWPEAGWWLSLVQLFAVTYCLYVFGIVRRDAYNEGRYGQVMGFIIAEMMLAGVIYGVVYYLLVNHWAVEHYAEQFEKSMAAMRIEGFGALLNLPDGVERMRQMMTSPLALVMSGMISMVLYGGVVGLFVAAFVRKRENFGEREGQN